MIESSCHGVSYVCDSVKYALSGTFSFTISATFRFPKNPAFVLFFFCSEVAVESGCLNISHGSVFRFFFHIAPLVSVH